MLEISAKNGLCDVILGSEVKTGFVYYSNVQRTCKDVKIKSTVFTMPHATKRHKIESYKETPERA